ncbi:MAG TPA: transporter substrate-binding domain-containing protein [Variovorax sp.]|nr:transporter substrate-binding domain-containing protein [Variovorax sp.]
MPDYWPGWRLRLRALLLSAGCLLALAGPAPAAEEPPRLVGFTNIPTLAVSLSGQESAWLEQHREIGAGIVANGFVPFDLLGLNNEYEGISADYLDAVAAALGLRVRVEVFRTREEARQALAQGRIDILPTVPDWLAAPSIALSAPYVALRHVEVTSRDPRIERAGAFNVGY